MGPGVFAGSGLPVMPRDLDLLVRAADVSAVAERLAQELVEPVFNVRL